MGVAYIILSYLVQGNLIGVAYRDSILQPLVQPSLKAIRPGVILQDDSARHVMTSCIPTVSRIDWPACSPAAQPPPSVNVNQLYPYFQQEWKVVIPKTQNSSSTHEITVPFLHSGQW